jgi:hypothetical protein
MVQGDPRAAEVHLDQSEDVDSWASINAVSSVYQANVAHLIRA